MPPSSVEDIDVNVSLLDPPTCAAHCTLPDDVYFATYISKVPGELLLIVSPAIPVALYAVMLELP